MQENASGLVGSPEPKRVIPVLGTQIELGLHLACLPHMPGVGAVVQEVVEYVSWRVAMPFEFSTAHHMPRSAQARMVISSGVR